MVKLNDKIQLNIIDVNYEGLGVAKYEEKVVFVEGAITNEVVSAKVDYIHKNYIRAHVDTIIEKSDDRCEKHCASYPNCGGCQIMHIKYQDGLEYKKRAFMETLRRIGHIEYDVKNIIGMTNPNGYRNKIQMPFGINKKTNEMILGYYAKGTHNVIPFKECYLQSDNISNLVQHVYNLLKINDISVYNEKTKKGCLRHLLIRENYKQELMLVFITNEENIKNIEEIIKSILKDNSKVVSIIQNINDKGTNVILGDKSKVLYGRDEIEDKIGEITYKISHKSFFQVNRQQAFNLYNKVLEYIGDGNSKVIDAYCGVGSISLMLATKCDFVFGIEVVKEAIDDAILNARLNNLNNTKFIVGKVEEEIFSILENEKIDAVVIDPPRKGIDIKVIDALNKSGIDSVVYVSCNPATLARDLELLSPCYNIDDITLVDMFCYTNGLESVVKLIRKK